MDIAIDNLPYVSVIIATFNDSQRLQKCLLSILNQTFPKNMYEIIVVDNNSDDNTVSFVSSLNRVRLFSEQRPGAYNARNLGILNSNGTVLVFTDSDCIASTNWLYEGVIHLLKDPVLGLVGGKVSYSYKFYTNPNVYELYDSSKFMNQKKCIEIGKFCVTANMFTYKKIFEKVGLFNADMLSGGDVEWGNRVHLRGYGISYCPSSIIYHPARNNFTQIYKKTVRVAKGYSLLEYNDLMPKEVIFKTLCKDLLPPLQKVISICKDKELDRFNIRIKLIIITCFFKYITTWNKIYSYFSSRQ